MRFARFAALDEPVFDFDEAKAGFLALCQNHGIPCPRVVPALPSDPCDVTSSDEVRLNVAAAQPIEPDYYVRHVFGHYLCDLHSAANAKTADMIADLIADLVTNPQEIAMTRTADCPHGEPLHHHPDGCPACSFDLDQINAIRSGQGLESLTGEEADPIGRLTDESLGN